MHAGLGVFIDNVGSCPGNIRALMNIPVRGIKLAGGLIRHYDDQDAVREYVDYVLNLCERHGVNVIAEHIEDEAQLERVRRLPIRYAQGYVFSPPVASVKRAQQPHYRLIFFRSAFAHLAFFRLIFSNLVFVAAAH